jgi:hypothetical protein
MKGAPGKPSVLVTGVAEPTGKTQDTELETAENRDGLAKVEYCYNVPNIMKQYTFDFMAKKGEGVRGQPPMGGVPI